MEPNSQGKNRDDRVRRARRSSQKSEMIQGQFSNLNLTEAWKASEREMSEKGTSKLHIMFCLCRYDGRQTSGCGYAVQHSRMIFTGDVTRALDSDSEYGDNANMPTFQIQKVINIFGLEVSRNALIQAEKAGTIPSSTRENRGSIKARAWELRDLPLIGERYGFLKKFARPQVMAVFSAKGGVLKTTLALNIARVAALHSIKTCIVGLDIQGDITKAMGLTQEIDEETDLNTAMSRATTFLSLADVFAGRASIHETILTSPDLPTLAIVPETSGLASLDVHLMSLPRREYWLSETVLEPLRERFDLVLMDCSPSWSQITSNALVGCDILVSPLETKINHFRNYPEFYRFLIEFERVMRMEHPKIFVPTRFNSTRKLSVEIRNWYLTNVPGCTAATIRESVTGEEAMSMCLSVPEFQPTSVAANEMRDLLREIWSRLPLRESSSPSNGAAAA